MADKDDQDPVSEDVPSGDDESKKEPPRSSSEFGRVSDQGASGFRKETFYEEQSFSPREILRRCLQDSFTDREDARTFCSDYCKEVYQDLSDTTPFSRISIKIIDNYEVRGRERDLWQWIRQRNASNYEKWFDKWEEAIRRHQDGGADASGSPREKDSGEKAKKDNAYSIFTGQIMKRVEPEGAERRATDSKSSGEAILASGDLESISDWFFSELTPSERGMVLASALFQGINRHYLAALSSDIADIFSHEPNTASTDNQS